MIYGRVTTCKMIQKYLNTVLTPILKKKELLKFKIPIPTKDLAAALKD